MSPHGRADGLAPTLAVFAVLGAGLLALFAGYPWFWLVFVLGFAVVVPLVAILTSDEGRDRPQDQARDAGREQDRDPGAHAWHGNRRGPWWQDVVDDDWWNDLATGSWWPDPERERERDREVRQRFGVPVDADDGAGNGDPADARPTGVTTTAREDDERAGGGSAGGGRAGDGRAVDVQAALEELRARYARGEVTDEQFDEELDRLLGRRDAGADEHEFA